MQIANQARDTGGSNLEAHLQNKHRRLEHGTRNIQIFGLTFGEPISKFKEAVESETGILTEVDSYDWITFLPMSDGMGAYNRYFGRLNTGKMKIRGVMARKGDTPEYVNRMQQEIFEVLAEARSLTDLQKTETKPRRFT